MTVNRPYNLGKRAEAAARTRAGIVDAAARLFGRDGFHNVTVEAVAAEAGVSRAAVYKHFPGKTEILAALQARLFEVGEIGRMREARMRPGAVRALRAFLRENCRFHATVGTRMRQAITGAQSDPEILRMIQAGYIEGRRGSIRELVARLREEGAIARGWTDERVVDALMILTNLETYETTSRDGERSHAEVARTLNALANAFLAG